MLSVDELTLRAKEVHEQFAVLQARFTRMLTVARRTRSGGSSVAQIVADRHVIEQAKGMIMARDRCDADRAFRTLIEMSQRRNVKLHDVACEFVARQSAPIDPQAQVTPATMRRKETPQR